jgi:hypothetical protein
MRECKIFPMFTNYSTAETPVPGNEWITSSQNERMELVRNAWKEIEKYSNLTVIDCRSNGEVFVEMKEPMSSNQRGTFLLDAEQVLKKQVDEALTIWLEPLGDKSTLRNLRGIKVKITRDDSGKNQIEGKTRE